MTDEELFAASERLSKTQGQFIEGMRLQIDTTRALTERIRSFQDYLETHQNLIDQDYDYAKTVQEALRAVLTAFAETQATINENTNRLDQVVTRMESYFGDGRGLEREN
jgi:methyl-accepting chemotaxis protein